MRRYSPALRWNYTTSAPSPMTAVASTRIRGFPYQRQAGGLDTGEERRAPLDQGPEFALISITGREAPPRVHFRLAGQVSGTGHHKPIPSSASFGRLPPIITAMPGWAAREFGEYWKSRRRAARPSRVPLGCNPPTGQLSPRTPFEALPSMVRFRSVRSAIRQCSVKQVLRAFGPHRCRSTECPDKGWSDRRRA